MLAMHMANELLTPGVAIAFILLSAAMLALSARLARHAFDPAKVPLMGVLGAFIFAAQMINFPVLPGTSGHLGGGVLLAILLGPHAATLVMASILIVQCLIFQDGGILALGANILNLGIVPAYLGYWVYTLFAGRAPGAARLYLSIFSGTMLGMIAGAAMVPVEAALSGVLAVPFPRFLLVMVALHLLIAFVEGLITFAVIAYVTRVRPQLLGPAAQRLQAASSGLSARAVCGSLLVVALLLGGVGSLFASAWPDALEVLSAGESSAGRLVHPNESGAVARATELQSRIAPLPDYHWTSFSGVFGTLLVLVVVWGIGRAMHAKPAHPHPPSALRVDPPH